MAQHGKFPVGWMEIISVNQLVMPLILPIYREAVPRTFITSVQVKQDLLIGLDACHFVMKELFVVLGSNSAINLSQLLAGYAL